MKYTIAHKIQVWIVRSTVFLGATLMIYVAFLLWWPAKTLVVKNAPMPIVGSKNLKAGDMVTYHYDYCKYYKDPLSIEKDFVDGIIYKTDPIYTTQLEAGCHQKDVSVRIPETLPTGEYKIRVITQVAINQLRTDTVIWETQFFNVRNED